MLLHCRLIVKAILQGTHLSIKRKNTLFCIQYGSLGGTDWKVTVNADGTFGIPKI
jgi:hypothetical protein